MIYGENVIVPLYDTNDSPVGIIHNGTPYWYVKNLQGDIVAIKDDTGTDVVRYSYDAWGKVQVNRDNSGCSLSINNPFLYRGYLYDREYNLYYLQSRYYDPEIGRWISPEPNIDNGRFDLAANLLAYNTYLYCANNPIIYKDETGESISLTILGVTIGAKGISVLIGTMTLLFAYTIDPTLRKSFEDAMLSVVTGLKSGINTFGEIIKDIIDWISSKKKAIEKSIDDSFAKSKSKPKYYGKNEIHHIVAKEAKNAIYAREVLDDVGINYLISLENLVSLKAGLHRRLHTNLYYGWANSVVISAYNSANGNATKEAINVYSALYSIRKFLLALNKIAPY